MSSQILRILAEAQFEIEEAFEHYRHESPRIAKRREGYWSKRLKQ